MRAALAFLAFLAVPLAEAQSAKAPVVVELFTSQACSSCPPAEAYFRELAGRNDVIALEWHVDYWNDLKDGANGRWKDPFSAQINTARQRIYNISILRKNGVYTPQAVVAGATEATGTDRKTIEKQIRAAAKEKSSVTVSAERSDKVRFTVEGAPEGAAVSLISFRRSAVTDIRGGENKGRKADSANLVTAWQELQGGPVYSAPLPAAGDGCALLLQAPGQGRILAAAYCP